MKRISIAAVALATMFALSLTAQAKGHGKCKAHKGWAIQKALKASGASAEQKDKIKALHKEMKAGKKDLKGKMKDKRKALHEALAADKRDDGAIDTLIGEMAALKADGAKAKMNFVKAATALLTGEQRAKFFDAMKSFQGKHGKGKHKGMCKGCKGCKGGACKDGCKCPGCAAGGKCKAGCKCAHGGGDASGGGGGL